MNNNQIYKGTMMVQDLDNKQAWRIIAGVWLYFPKAGVWWCNITHAVYNSRRCTKVEDWR